MSKNAKWSSGEKRERPDKPMYGVLFNSRNKDNGHLEGFKERRKSFTTTKTVEELMEDFKAFVNMGKPGEFCRFYYSNNERSQEKTQKALMHYLLDHQVNMPAMESLVLSFAMNKEQAVTKKWFFDFDGTEEQLPEFLEDLNQAVKENEKLEKKKKKAEVEVEVKKTPNGYAVVVSRGFKADKLLEKWSRDENGEELVTLKKDDFLCVAWAEKE